MTEKGLYMTDAQMIHAAILLIGIGIGIYQYKKTGEIGYAIATIAYIMIILFIEHGSTPTDILDQTEF
jgi:hypothetical protein